MFYESNVSRAGDGVSRGREFRAGYPRMKIIVLLIDGFPVMQLGTLAEVFELANQLGRVKSAFNDRYDLLLFSANGGPVRSSSGVQIWTEEIDRAEPGVVDAMFVLGGQNSAHAMDERTIEWLRDAHHRARIVKGGGGGEQLLTQLHLTRKDGADAQLMIRSMLTPAADGVSPRASGDDDQSVFPTALSIVGSDMGYEVAQELVASMMPGAIRKFASVAFGPREARASDLIRAAAYHLRVNSANRISIADAAQAAAMSERNFLRRFKQEIGVTPTEFVLRVRLEAACCMLVETDLPADKVARRTGLGSGDRLAKLFRQHLSMSPTEYRAAARSRMMSTVESASGIDMTDWLKTKAS